MSDSKGIEAVFQHGTDGPKIPCKLTARRRIKGVWNYLAVFRNGTAQWIDELCFVEVKGRLMSLPKRKDI